MLSFGRRNTSVTVIKGSCVDISANSSRTSNSSYLEMTSPSNSTARDFPVEYLIAIIVGVFLFLCIYFFIVLAKSGRCEFCPPRCCCCFSCDFCSSTPTEIIPGQSEERRQEVGSGSSNCAPCNVGCVGTNNGCSEDSDCCGGSSGCRGGSGCCFGGIGGCCDRTGGCWGEWWMWRECWMWRVW